MTGATITAIDVEEGDTRSTKLEFLVQLDQIPASNITIPYRIIPGNVTDNLFLYYDNNRYTTGDLNFYAGRSPSDTASIYIAGDYVAENDQSLTIELLPTLGIDYSSGSLTKQAVAWVHDDDGTTNPLSLWVSSPTVIEGEHNKIVFDMELSEPADKKITIKYDLSGSATAGEDYTDKSGEITFSKGQQQETLTVNLLRDKDEESLEYLDLDLELPSAVKSVTGGRATIIDDDTNETSLPFVTATAISGREGDTTSYNVIEYSVMLSSPATSTVTLPYRILSGTGSTSSDSYYGATRFVSGTKYIYAGDSQTTISYYIDNDYDVENDESFILELLTPTGAVLPGNAVSYKTTGWTLDDDGNPKPLALQIDDVAIMETDGNETYAVFNMELSRAAPRDLQLEYRTVSGTADTNFDFKKTSGKTTIEEGQKTASVAVKIIGDDSNEITETFSLSVKGPGIISEIDGGLATIYNDDTNDDNKWVEIDGTNDDDKYTGNDQKEEIRGKKGDDKLYGRGGKDKIYGDEGKDKLYGQKGDDKVYGGKGNDLIDGSGGKDYLYGQNGNDEMSGGNDGDYMSGGNGNDEMKGGKGKDTMIAGDGKDTLTGNNSDDTFIFDRDDDKNFITDFEDKDDMIKITSGADRYRDLKVKKDGKDVEISWAKTVVILEDTDRDDIGSSDFIF